MKIVTPFRVMYENDVVSVLAPGITGYFGILANHHPFLTHLSIGTIVVDTGRAVKTFATSGGYTEVLKNVMTILAETAEESSEIDVDRAKRARDRALVRMKQHSPDIDFDRARLALLRALNRLRAFQA